MQPGISEFGSAGRCRGRPGMVPCAAWPFGARSARHLAILAMPAGHARRKEKAKPLIPSLSLPSVSPFSLAVVGTEPSLLLFPHLLLPNSCLASQPRLKPLPLLRPRRAGTMTRGCPWPSAGTECIRRPRAAAAPLGRAPWWLQPGRATLQGCPSAISPPDQAVPSSPFRFMRREIEEGHRLESETFCWVQVQIAMTEWIFRSGPG
jgi:hypothetical protein